MPRKTSDGIVRTPNIGRWDYQPMTPRYAAPVAADLPGIARMFRTPDEHMIEESAHRAFGRMRALYDLGDRTAKNVRVNPGCVQITERDSNGGRFTGSPTGPTAEDFAEDCVLVWRDMMGRTNARPYDDAIPFPVNAGTMN